MRFHVRDQRGKIFDLEVADIRPDGVLLDFNHPLAGETLHFDVKTVTL
jgi:FKBP-type peptidyl-prolyl cis-trans isomerase SlyD